jgi:hypothetical protein
MASRSRRTRNQNQPLLYNSEGFTRLASDAAAPSVQALHTAKARLAGELERLGDPVSDALEVISPVEFAELVWRLPNPGRTEFLRDLKVPAAKKPAPATASMGLNRLRTWSSEQRLKGVYYVSTSALWGLSAALERWLDDRDDEALATSLVEDQSQINVIRLMVVTHWYDAAELVAALRCGLLSGLALPTWPAEVINEVVAACRTLERVRFEDGETQHDTVGTVTSDRLEVTANVRSASEDGQSEMDAAVPVSVDHLTATSRDLGRAMVAAHEKAVLFVQCLENKKLPGIGQLEPIHELYAVVERVKSVVHGANTQFGLDHAAAEPTETEDCGALQDMLTVAVNAASDERTTREDLTRLVDITGPETSREALGKIRELAQELVRIRPWDEFQRKHVSALAALLRLVDAAAADDSSTAMEYYPIAHEHLPAGVTPIVAMALLGKLTIPHETLTPASFPRKERLPQSEDAGVGVTEPVPAPDGGSTFTDAPTRQEHPEPAAEESATTTSLPVDENVPAALTSTTKPEPGTPEPGHRDMATMQASDDTPLDAGHHTVTDSPAVGCDGVK